MHAPDPPSWAIHLPDGETFALPEPGTLAGAWVARLSEDPGRPLLHDEAGWTTRGAFLERTGTVAGRLAAAGLVAGDVLIGGLYVGKDTAIRPFNQRTLSILTIFAAQASLILQNALLLN